ncbi:DUF4168 domain-containing protein [Salipiger sp. 1_MG-2023]|uniref:DUF4168 domain-containing protein n=1 Tax=Salipiger sp. 1_MG-2023 TaxID=3062665 RepID=UPI0026E179A1|nr:DUF4168 domain-containing protein [Salipiger sp. 1_MG-2023]MDO6587456.1 DUF4168 domain-containing protein [Salipiger sp. 1_MG-2023]
MTLNGTLTKSAVILALVVAPVAPVMAQSVDSPQAPAQSPAPVAPEAGFSETELTSFVDAALSVQAVQQEYAARIEATPEAEDKQALVMRAQDEMVTAVEATEGMDVETYNEISAAAQADPALNERLMAMVQTRAPQTPPTATE